MSDQIQEIGERLDRIESILREVGDLLREILEMQRKTVGTAGQGGGLGH